MKKLLFLLVTVPLCLFCFSACDTLTSGSSEDALNFPDNFKRDDRGADSDEIYRSDIYRSDIYRSDMDKRTFATADSKDLEPTPTEKYESLIFSEIDRKRKLFIWKENLIKEPEFSQKLMMKVEGADGVWSKPQKLTEDKVERVDFVKIDRLNAFNDRILVFVASDSAGNTRLFSRRIDSDGSLGETKIIESSKERGTLLRPRIERDNSGNAIVIWERQQDLKTSIYASHLQKTGSWSNPVKLDSEKEDAISGDLSFTFFEEGRALAAWVYSETKPHKYQVKYSIFSDSKWSKALTLKSASKTRSGGPRLSALPKGKVIITWWEPHNSYFSLYSSIYSSDTGFSEKQLIEDQDLFHVSFQSIKSNAKNVYCVWEQATSDTLSEVYYSKYDLDEKKWSKALLLSEKGDALNPKLFVSSEGDAFVKWFHSKDNSGNLSLDVSYFNSSKDLWTLIPYALSQDEGFRSLDAYLGVDELFYLSYFKEDKAFYEAFEKSNSDFSFPQKVLLESPKL